jgi:hypothetical protein
MLRHACHHASGTRNAPQAEECCYTECTLIVSGELRMEDMLRTIFSIRTGFSISDDPAHLPPVMGLGPVV